MAQFLLIVFSIFLVFHDVQPCCFPKQFEGLEGISGGEVINGKGIAISGLFNISLDFTIKKVAASGNVRYNDVTITEQILQDFSAGKQYVVVPSCVPAEAKKVMSTYYGIGDHKTNLDMYSGTILNQTYVLTVAPDDGCIPISQHIEVSNAITNTGFMGLTLGIKDMKVFKIPTACLHPSNGPASQLVIDYMQNRHHSLFIHV